MSVYDMELEVRPFENDVYEKTEISAHSWMVIERLFRASLTRCRDATEQAAILAERERCKEVIMREILDDAEVYEAENHNVTIKLFAAAIMEEPRDG